MMKPVFAYSSTLPTACHGDLRPAPRLELAHHQVNASSARGIGVGLGMQPEGSVAQAVLALLEVLARRLLTASHLTSRPVDHSHHNETRFQVDSSKG